MVSKIKAKVLSLLLKYDSSILKLKKKPNYGKDKSNDQSSFNFFVFFLKKNKETQFQMKTLKK